MADLCLTYAEIVDLVEDYKGWDTVTATQSAWALDRVNEGLRQFIRAQYIDERGIVNTHSWNFLEPDATLDITKATTTADGVPVDAGGGTTTVDVDDAIFTSLMVGSRITFSTTGNAYVIASYTDTTTVVVTGDATGEADEDVVTVTPYTLLLPDNWGGLVHPIVYLHDGVTSIELYERKRSDIDRLYRNNQTSGTPANYAIISDGVPSTAIQKWKVMLHPTPDAAKTLNYRYRIRVDRATDSVTAFPPGGSDFCDAIVECARAAAEYQSGGQKNGEQQGKANAAILSAVYLDREMYGEAPQEHVYLGDDTGRGVNYGRYYRG